MDEQQRERLLLEVHQKVATILERLNGMNQVCSERREILLQHDKRIAKLERYVQRDEVYRKTILGMLTALFALVSWATNALPKLAAMLK